MARQFKEFRGDKAGTLSSIVLVSDILLVLVTSEVLCWGGGGSKRASGGGDSRGFSVGAELSLTCWVSLVMMLSVISDFMVAI